MEQKIRCDRDMGSNLKKLYNCGYEDFFDGL